MELKDWIEKAENEYLTKTELKNAMKVAEENNSAKLAYDLACIEGADRKSAERIVLNAKDPKYC